MSYFDTNCIDYDCLNDVLNIKFADTSNSYGDEIQDGIVVLRDLDTEEVTGVTIFYYERRTSNG